LDRTLCIASAITPHGTNTIPKPELEYRNGELASYYVIMYISRKDEKIYRNMFVIGGDDAIGMPHG
jgi:hypothetical protein